MKLKMIGMVLMMMLVKGTVLQAEEYSISSPDGKTAVKVQTGEKLLYSVTRGGCTVVNNCPISLTIKDRPVLGQNIQAAKASKRTVKQELKPVVQIKEKIIKDEFEELTISCGDYSVIFRAYDDGAAYRFATNIEGEITVIGEEVAFIFNGDCSAYFRIEGGFLTHYEGPYTYQTISKFAGQMCTLPLLVEIKDGPRVAITEADLFDYPGCYLVGKENNTMSGVFPAVALKEEAVDDRTVKVTERADYIAVTKGKRTFPWRVLAIADKDADLLNNQMVYKLAGDSQIKDTSWIKPGKVAWDWWNALNIYGVDFEAGVNTATYKYFIDFASKYKIEYIILDEGWYTLGNLLSVVPQIDIPELVAYGKKKNVDIILWMSWKTLDDQFEPAMDQFAKWGIKGIKVDFMQRDDQKMVQYYEKVAREAAKRHMLVDFHGAYKPVGMIRTFPNVITSEGVMGMEHCKWGDNITPRYNVTLPFTRMLAGPMDYTPGAMINAPQRNFKFIFERPMSMGTRCHQLAMYVIFESPLQMLSDSPSNYLREPECMEFLGPVPSVWDQTIALDAKVAEYVMMARRSGKDWYVGALTNEDGRKLTVDFSFLPAGKFTLTAWQDGPNANRCGIDYKKITRKVKKGDKLEITLAPGGGWAGRITAGN